MPIDATALQKSLARLAERAHAADLSTTLDAVARSCVDIFGVDGSGIMIADEQNIPRYVAATDGPGRLLERFESETGQGPCTDAFVTNVIVPVTDLATDPRWPDLAAAVVPHGVHAVLGVPVRMDGITVGTIDVYRSLPHDWDDAEQAALSRFGEVVGSTLATALSAHRAQNLADQLQYALDYRVVIERGVGYLMARDGIDAVSAFNRLRRAARDGQRKIGDVAAQLVGTGRLPTE